MGVPLEEWFEPVDVDVIKRKVRTLVGHYGYRHGDLEDLQQEVQVRVGPAMRKFVASRGQRGAYLGRVVTNAICKIIELRTAHKRDRRGDVPLDEGVAGERHDGDIRFKRTDLRLDIQQVLAEIPTELRRITTLLMKGLKVVDICRCTGMSRQQVRSRIRALAEHFQHLRNCCGAPNQPTKGTGSSKI